MTETENATHAQEGAINGDWPPTDQDMTNTQGKSYNYTQGKQKYACIFLVSSPTYKKLKNQQSVLKIH
jgi:hypothetical protein